MRQTPPPPSVGSTHSDSVSVWKIFTFPAFLTDSLSRPFPSLFISLLFHSAPISPDLLPIRPHPATNLISHNCAYSPFLFTRMLLHVLLLCALSEPCKCIVALIQWTDLDLVRDGNELRCAYGIVCYLNFSVV